MAEYITKIQTAEGEKQIDYNALANLPITYIESIPGPDATADDLVAIRDLTNGFYILYGKFTPHKGSGYVYTFSDNVLVSIVRKTSASHVQIFYPVNNALQYLQITDNSYNRQDAKLVNMEDITRRVSTISETSDDEHYPSAKAVYDAVKAERTAAREYITLTDSATGTPYRVYVANGKLAMEDENGNIITVDSGTKKVNASVELLADNWVSGGEKLWSQVVEISGVTSSSQIELTPSVEQLAIFHNKDIAFVAGNKGGVVTIYAIGQKPTNDYIMQVTIEEVTV